MPVGAKKIIAFTWNKARSVRLIGLVVVSVFQVYPRVSAQLPIFLAIAASLTVVGLVVAYCIAG